MKLLSTSVLAVFLASLALGACSNKQEENVEAAAAEAVEKSQEHAEHAAEANAASGEAQDRKSVV